jgi:hypothetical protein
MPHSCISSSQQRRPVAFAEAILSAGAITPVPGRGRTDDDRDADAKYAPRRTVEDRAKAILLTDCSGLFPRMAVRKSKN